MNSPKPKAAQLQTNNTKVANNHIWDAGNNKCSDYLPDKCQRLLY